MRENVKKRRKEKVKENKKLEGKSIRKVKVKENKKYIKSQ